MQAPWGPRIALTLCALAMGALLIADSVAQETKESANASPDETPSANADLDTGSSEFTVELGAGVQYDDNVTVDEIDQATNIGDFAALFDIGLDYEREFGQGTELTLGYDLSQRAYFDETDFDLQIHSGSIRIKHDFGDYNLGLSGREIYARLGGDGFLNIAQVQPYASGFITDILYLRGAYTFRDKAFEQREDRDATVHMGELDGYFFLDGASRYLLLGYRFENEDTNAPQFDFDGHNFKVRYSHEFELAAQQLEFNAGWRYEQRNYSNITPSIGVKRDDDRHRLRAGLELFLTNRLTAGVEYQYRDYSSNLPAADYNENRVTVDLSAGF